MPISPAPMRRRPSAVVSPRSRRAKASDDAIALVPLGCRCTYTLPSSRITTAWPVMPRYGSTTTGSPDGCCTVKRSTPVRPTTG